MRDHTTKRRFIELRAEGKSYREIASILNISTGTCTKWNRELESEIRELKSEQIEEMHDEYYLMRSQRIEALARKVRKLEVEMEIRDLSDIPTRDIWRLHSQYYALLKGEVIELNNEKPERSLNAMIMDIELVERLVDPNVLFLKEDAEENLGHLDTIASIHSRFAKDEEITDAMRDQYREAICKLNRMYRRYGMRIRADIIFDLIPRRDQALFAEVERDMRELEKRMAGKSLVLMDSITDRDRRMYLKTMQLRAFFLRNYGFSVDDLEGEPDGEYMPRFTEGGRSMLERLIEEYRLSESPDSAGPFEEEPTTDSGR